VKYPRCDEPVPQEFVDALSICTKDHLEVVWKMVQKNCGPDHGVLAGDYEEILNKIEALLRAGIDKLSGGEG